jgi:hypothetical protein
MSSAEEGEEYGLVVEVVTSGPGQVVVGVRPLEVVLDVVAQKRGMKRSDNNAWVEAVRAKLADVGVVTLRQFVMNVLVLNQKLRARHHRELHETTLNQVLAEVCEMVMGPEVVDEEAGIM